VGRAKGNATNQKSGLAWVGANEAVAAGIVNASVVRARNGTTTKELIDINGFDEVVTAGSTWGLGTLAGTNFGLVFQDQGGSWLELAGASTNSMRAIAPLDDGAMIAGQVGFFAVVRPGLKKNAPTTVCPIVMYASGTTRNVVPIGNDMVAAFDSGGPTEVVFLSRTGPLKACPR
jgi:hypothetical protein